MLAERTALKETFVAHHIIESIIASHFFIGIIIFHLFFKDDLSI